MENRWRKNNSRKSALGQRRKKINRIKTIFFFVFIIALVAIAAWLLRHPSVTLENISISGNEITPSEELDVFIEEILEGSYVFIVPKRSSLFFPEEYIENAIPEKFTRIERASVRKVEKDLHVTITERDPFGLWCDGERSTTTIDSNVGQCYFIDLESYIFATAPKFSGNVFFTYFGDLHKHGENASSSITGQFMEETIFGAYNVFIESFKEFDFEPISLTRVDEKDFEIGLDTGAIIIFGNDTPLGVLLDNMETVVESEAFKAVDRNNLEYIDLRFGNRVYYKQKGEEEIEQ